MKYEKAPPTAKPMPTMLPFRLALTRLEISVRTHFDHVS